MKIKSFISIGITILFATSYAMASIQPFSFTQNTANFESHMQTFSYFFPCPVINKNNGYSEIIIDGVEQHLLKDGMPMIPYLTETLIFPIGTVIKSIEIVPHNITKLMLQNKVMPGPKPLSIENDILNSERNEGEVYQESSIFPEKWATYSIGVGLENLKHVTFLSLYSYPVRYEPTSNFLYSTDGMTITVCYDIPLQSVVTNESYDMVIIAPDEFTESILPLVTHKESFGIKTKITTIEDIYSGTYFTPQGRDNPEKIKYFIKDAVEQWGITYVLLVGGMIGQQYDYYVPVRYTNNHAGADFEYGFISDLYYADLFKYDNGQVVFEDWDSNNNGIFAEFTASSKDITDCRPDVYLGRLPCQYLSEVEIMVNKIITYESEGCDPAWFNRMLCIGGDTYPNAGDPVAYEAEIDTNLSASYMAGFEIERLWASLGTLTGQTDVEEAFDRGAGFVHMAGHANPGVLVTHPPQDEEGRIVILQVYNLPLANAFFRLTYFDIAGAISAMKQPRMPTLSNREKLPIVVVGGCHNSQFNTSIFNILKYGFIHAYGYGIHVPKCWSWWLTSNSDGGSIATLGNTGLGMGLEAWDYTEGLDGWLFPRFFYHYGVLGEDVLSQCHSSAITDYANMFPINQGDGADRQMLEQWALFGDPSLKIGGYQ